MQSSIDKISSLKNTLNTTIDKTAAANGDDFSKILQKNFVIF